MPSFRSRNPCFDGASILPDRRGRSAYSRKAGNLHHRLAHNQDSSMTDHSAEPTEKDALYRRTGDTAVGEVNDFQPHDNNVDGVKAGIACPDVLQYKVENEHLKELLRSRTHDLREECSALSICQTELAEALISQTADDNSVQGRQLHKLARNLKDRLSHRDPLWASLEIDAERFLWPSLSGMQMKLLREERDQAALDLTALSGKMTTCTTIAEEQAKLLKGQLDTIRKFEQKIQILEKAAKDMRAGHRQTVHELERSLQEMEAAYNEKLQNYENSMQRLLAKHKEKLQDSENTMQHLHAKHNEDIQVLEQSIHDMRAGYKQERAALEEQLGLHEQRAALQDRKIKNCQHELEMVRSEILKARTREAEMEDHLQAQANICQKTTTELYSATKEIERLKIVSLELHELEERMEQLWVDNARLVQLLAETEEYQSFVHDMQGGTGLVFCPSTSRFQSLAERYGAGTSYGPINPKKERDQWIPAELFDLVMAFRKQHCFGSEIEVVQDLLRLVTTFWRERHKKIVYKVKAKHEKQLADLTRQLSQRLPYGEVVQSSHPRSTTNGAQPSKTIKTTSLASHRRELYSAAPQYGPTRDIEYIGSLATRRAVVDELYGAHYRARDGNDDTSNPKEASTKYRESSPKRKGRGNRSEKLRPVSYMDGHRSALTGGNPGDEHEFPNSGVARDIHEPDGQMGGISTEARRSYAARRGTGSKQRNRSKHSARAVVSESSKKSKSGLLQRFVGQEWTGDEEEKEKINHPDRLGSKQQKDWFLRRTVPSSSEGPFDEEGDKLGPAGPRRTSSRTKDDLDGFRSFSGSSSV